MSDIKDKDFVRVGVPLNVNFTAGFLVGILTGIGFHPIDRAFYLSAKEKLKDRQHLFAPKYWTQPMTGLRNTLYQRTLSNGVYFALQGELNTRLYPLMKKEWLWGDKVSKLCVGLTAGGITGFFSNASYAVKFYTITHRPKGKPLENSREMWRLGGYKPFLNGAYASVARDATFGAFYEMSNLLLDEHVVRELQNKTLPENNKTRDSIYFVSRFFSAGLATAMSSPWNYARNMQFKTRPQKKQPLILDLWCEVWRESNKVLKLPAKKGRSKQLVPLPEKQSFCPRLKFFQSKFMIGVGTVRAAAGMAVGQLLFNKTAESIRGLDVEARRPGKDIKNKARS